MDNMYTHTMFKMISYHLFYNSLSIETTNETLRLTWCYLPTLSSQSSLNWLLIFFINSIPPPHSFRFFLQMKHPHWESVSLHSFFLPFLFLFFSFFSSSFFFFFSSSSSSFLAEIINYVDKISEALTRKFFLKKMGGKTPGKEIAKHPFMNFRIHTCYDKLFLLPGEIRPCLAPV